MAARYRNADMAALRRAARPRAPARGVTAVSEASFIIWTKFSHYNTETESDTRLFTHAL